MYNIFLSSVGLLNVDMIKDTSDIPTYIVLCALLIGMVLAFVIAAKINQSDKEKARLFELNARRHKSELLLIKIYSVLDSFVLTRRLVRSVAKRFRLLYPVGTREPDVKAAGLALIYSAVAIIVGFLGIVTGPLLAGIAPTPFVVATVIFLIYIINLRITLMVRAQLESEFLDSFGDYVSAVKHYYYRSFSIRDAVLDAQPRARKTMRSHATMLGDILSSSDREEMIRTYLASGYNSYLQVFLLTADLCMKFGDCEGDKASPFERALEGMKVEAREDARKIRTKETLYTGLDLLAGIPLVLFPYIARWAIRTVPNMMFAYVGEWGHLLSLLAFVTVYSIYSAVIYIRSGDLLYRPAHAIAQKLSHIPPFSFVCSALVSVAGDSADERDDQLRNMMERFNARTMYMAQVLLMVLLMVLSTMAIIFGQDEGKEIIKTDISTIQNQSGLESRTIDMVSGAVPFFVNEIIEKDLYLTDEVLAAEVRDYGIYSSAAINYAVGEIQSRVAMYRSQGFGMREGLIVLAFGFVGYMYLPISIKFKKTMTDTQMTDEVRKFQTLIALLAPVPGMTSMLMLETLENFSYMFKRPIQKCVNTFAVNRQQALDRLREDCQNVQFRRIIDCFEFVPLNGIKLAFSEVSQEIEDFREDRRAENMKQLEKNKIRANILAPIPAVLAAIYLFGPFLADAFSQYSDYQEALQMFKGVF